MSLGLDERPQGRPPIYRAASSWKCRKENGHQATILLFHGSALSRTLMALSRSKQLLVELRHQLLILSVSFQHLSPPSSCFHKGTRTGRHKRHIQRQTGDADQHCLGQLYQQPASCAACTSHQRFSTNTGPAPTPDKSELTSRLSVFTSWVSG